jgi:hypothetical protein
VGSYSHNREHGVTDDESCALAGDSKPGQTGGEGITLDGRKCYAGSASGAAMTAGSKGSSGFGSSGTGSAGGGPADW